MEGARRKQLGDVIPLVDDVEVRLRQATVALEPLVAALDAKDDESDALLGRISDQIWNEVGRPASNPALSVLLSGGVAYYADGSVAQQPSRMELLAELLDRACTLGSRRSW